MWVISLQPKISIQFTGKQIWKGNQSLTAGYLVIGPCLVYENSPTSKSTLSAVVRTTNGDATVLHRYMNNLIVSY